MSARKYSAPRYGSKRFLPHSRTKKARGHVSFHPKNDESKPVHLTSFLAYKAGCTHVIREVSKPKSPLHQREVSEMVTVLETPDMVCVGYVLYKDTPVGVKAIYTEHIDNVSDAYMRAVEPKLNRHANLPKAFSNKENKAEKKEYSGDSYDFIRVILHTIPPSSVERKKAHVIESQVNGGSNNDEKLEYARNLLGKNVPISAFTVQNETVDIAGVTKGKGFQGVIKRFGVRALRKKARKGSRRVGCIGPWHPSNVSFAVARAGQMGKNHRTDLNKQVMLIGKPEKESVQGNASTPYDPTNKHITPLGGFKNYGEVKGDFIIVKGSVTGPAKGCVALRKSVNDPYKGEMTQEARIKFIDTASKVGKGRFQTNKEKNEFFGYKNSAEVKA